MSAEVFFPPSFPVLQSSSFGMGLQQGGCICVGALHGDGEWSSTTLRDNKNEEQEIRIQT